MASVISHLLRYCPSQIFRHLKLWMTSCILDLLFGLQLRPVWTNNESQKVFLHNLFFVIICLSKTRQQPEKYYTGIHELVWKAQPFHILHSFTSYFIFFVFFSIMQEKPELDDYWRTVFMNVCRNLKWLFDLSISRPLVICCSCGFRQKGFCSWGGLRNGWFVWIPVFACERGYSLTNKSVHYSCV